jgi:uncharacterized protein (DUF1499 family)/alpha-beta hydrolase superfamily lysophospholipase
MHNFLTTAAAVLLGIWGCSSNHAALPGLQNGHLAQCPESPNCVSSQSLDATHRVEPLRFRGSPAAARTRLLQALAQFKRVRIVTDQGSYIHAEFTSSLFRFVDDVEFSFDTAAGQIHVRSASRRGYYDLGANRRRVKAIRSAFDALASPSKGDPALHSDPTSDYAALDRPEVLSVLFHPRQESGALPLTPPSQAIMIPVDDGIRIGARFHIVEPAAPSILFFHGNGEIAADYDDLALLYNRMGINFLAVDYRGYGRSEGRPSVAAMMRDCRSVFRYVNKWRGQNGLDGPLLVMGRSLGSASALDIAAALPSRVDALIIESGFAFASPLLRLLGTDPERIGFRESAGFRNVDKIAAFDGPTLIIHAEYDHIIPFTDAKTLYDTSPATDKTLLKIPGANHNDIFMRGMPAYLEAIKALSTRTLQRHTAKGR